MRNFIEGFFGAASTLILALVCSYTANHVYEQNTTVHVELILPKKTYSQPYLQYVFNDEEIKCLEQNMFYEARNQGDVGMLMVGFVTMHRMEKSKDHTICNSVHTKHSCSFSWTCAKKKQEVDWNSIITKRAWERSQALTIALLVGNEVDFTKGANFYHTKSVNPYWSHAKGFMYLGTINDHKLYRFDG